MPGTPDSSSAEATEPPTYRQRLARRVGDGLEKVSQGSFEAATRVLGTAEKARRIGLPTAEWGARDDGAVKDDGDKVFDDSSDADDVVVGAAGAAVDPQIESRFLRPVFPTSMREVRAYSRALSTVNNLNIYAGLSATAGGLTGVWLGGGAVRGMLSSRVARGIGYLIVVPASASACASAAAGICIAAALYRVVDDAGEVLVRVGPRTDRFLRRVLGPAKERKGGGRVAAPEGQGR